MPCSHEQEHVLAVVDNHRPCVLFGWLPPTALTCAMEGYRPEGKLPSALGRGMVPIVQASLAPCHCISMVAQYGGVACVEAIAAPPDTQTS